MSHPNPPPSAAGAVSRGPSADGFLSMRRRVVRVPKERERESAREMGEGGRDRAIEGDAWEETVHTHTGELKL